MKRLYSDGKDYHDVSKGIAKKTKTHLDDSVKIFKNLNISILPTGIGNTRCKLFSSQIKANGGTVIASINNSATHLIVNDTFVWKELGALLKTLDIKSNPELKIVKSVWLSRCLKQKSLLSTADFEIKPTENKETSILQGVSLYKELKEKTSGSSSVKNLGLLESGHASTSKTNNNNNNNLPGKWVCSFSSLEKPVNNNKHITEKLQLMAETYKNTKDQWRAFSYEKVINTLNTWPKEIESLEEARNIPGVGARLADKIWEIIESGSLRKLEITNSYEDIKAINLFAQVWGAGPTTAQAWVQQGFRTLEDLRTRAKLTRQQQIGLKHYDDLLERMPREEAAKIVKKVKDVALSINPDLEAVGCGSFRRGKALCGDVDILFTHPDGKTQAGLLVPIVQNLTQSGFLTDHLVSPEPDSAHQTYMGVCCLDTAAHKHRRLDLFVVPVNEFGPALLAYTGSGHFNRSMRLLARKKGMTLSHKSLKAGVIRKGQNKIYEGYVLPTPTEESIFEHLGLEYRKPEERDH